FRILHFRIESLGVTPIYFDVIHSPRSIRLGILEFMIETPGPLLASQSTGIGIQTELQPFAVYVIGQGFDTTGKSSRIGHNVSLGIAADLPAVIDVDVLVARRLKAGADHCVRYFANQL